MYPELSPEKLAELRESLLNLPQRFAAVEAVIYAEKCATLPHLSIEERLARFSDLYELGVTFRAHNGPIPALVALHIQEIVEFRKTLAKIAGRRPPE